MLGGAFCLPTAPLVMRSYFDHNATAPLDVAVLESMLPYLHGGCGNASSRHEDGRRSYEAVERARTQVAAAVNARPAEVFFTSSGTESNNLVIKGVTARSSRTNVVISGIEHPCVLCAARAMARRGGTMVPLAVDEQGLLDFADLDASLADGNAAIVSVMLANNETGVVQDVARVVAAAQATGTVVHSDAAQALGKIPVDFASLGVDAMTLSGHKARGPMGIAALVKRAAVDCEPLLEGGGHEDGLRSGTLNVPGIVGFGQAAELAAARVVAEGKRLAVLRGELEACLQAQDAVVFGQAAPRLPNTSYFGIPGIEGETLVVLLDQAGFAVTSGAACATNKNEASHVLQAMGMSELVARTAVRVSLGAGNDQSQVVAFCAAVQEIAARLHSMAANVSA